MIDLHNHLLPGIDDGAATVADSLAMAKAFEDQGVRVVACTPHIVPGLYHTTGPDIRERVAALQSEIDQAGITLRLVAGADNHVTPNFSARLREGHLLALADTRYVLVEPAHHIVTPRLEDPDRKIPFDCSPGAGRRTLTPEQKQLLDRTIDQGECCEGPGCC